MRSQALLREERANGSCGCHLLRSRSSGKRVDENGEGDSLMLFHLAVFSSFFFYLDPGILILLLLSDSSRAEVIDFLNYFHGCVNDTMLYLCMLKKDARGRQCFTQSLANES